MSERREALETQRDELIERLQRYRAHRHRDAGALDKDMDDQALEVQNDEVVESLEAEAEEELAQVEHALERLAAGQGERCERCGATIAPGRLAAPPYSTLCVDCAGA